MQVAQSLTILHVEHFVCHATLGVLTLGRSPTGFPLNLASPIWTSIQIWDTGSSSWPTSHWTCLARDPLAYASPGWTSVQFWDTGFSLYSLGVGGAPLFTRGILLPGPLLWQSAKNNHGTRWVGAVASL